MCRLMSAFRGRAGLITCPVTQETKGNTVMNVTIGLEDANEILGRDVSDEALELAGAAGQEMAGAYTLQFCTTSRDCAG
jgi:hypothetical protein